MTAIIAFLTTRLANRFGLRAGTIAKGIVYIGIPIALILIILFSGWWIQGCIVNRKIEKVNQAVDKLKIEEKKIEAKAKVDYNNSERKEVVAEVAEKKAEEAKKVVEDIKHIEGVSYDEALNSLCLAYPENPLCK